MKILLPERWGIIGNDHQLGLSHSQCFEGLFVAQLEFARFHDQSQSAVDRLNCLLLFLLSSHFVDQRRNSDELSQSQSSHAKCCCKKEERKRGKNTAINIYFYLP